LDLMVVTAALLDLVVDILAAVMPDREASVTILGLLRLLRIARVLRVLRISKLIRFVTPLRSLLFSIVVTLRHLIWSLVLLLMLIFIFAMLFSRTTIDYSDAIPEDRRDALQRYWQGLFVSMMTLFKAATGGMNWQDCSDVLREISPVLELCFASYIIITCFAVLNVVTGTFCQSAMKAAESDPNMIAVTMANKKKKREEMICELFDMIDRDHNGRVSYEEMQDMMTNTQIQASFEVLGLEVRDSWMLFRLLDEDRDHLIDMDEFMQGCKLLSGQASALDLFKLSYEVKRLVKQLAQFVTDSLPLRHLSAPAVSESLPFPQSESERYDSETFPLRQDEAIQS